MSQQKHLKIGFITNHYPLIMTNAPKTIKQCITAQCVNMGGHLIDQPLPVRTIAQIDPFLLIHHWDSPLPGNQQPDEVGVGPHPHRGFSPVTFFYKGDIHHRDSIGNDAIVGEGGTQWMHAGKGVIHSERPSASFAMNGGIQEFIQFWVNTPAQYKMEEPYYLPITQADTPSIQKGNALIHIVAGEFETIKGPAKTYSPQLLLRIQAEPMDGLKLSIPTHFNTILYVLNGTLNINGKSIRQKEMVWFNNDGDHINLNVTSSTRFILLSGEPIGEPIQTYGPFVMNTRRELMEAIEDVQSGKMGILNEVF